MAHYAFIDDNNIVVEVITGRDEYDLPEGIVSWEAHYGEFRGMTCVRTSYNTYIDSDGVSQHGLGGTPFRGKYAGIGYTYDATNDVFIPEGFTYDADTNTFTTPVVEDAPE